MKTTEGKGTAFTRPVMRAARAVLRLLLTIGADGSACCRCGQTCNGRLRGRTPTHGAFTSRCSLLVGHQVLNALTRPAMYKHVCQFHKGLCETVALILLLNIILQACYQEKGSSCETRTVKSVGGGELTVFLQEKSHMSVRVPHTDSDGVES